MAIATWHNECVGGRRGHGEGNGQMTRTATTRRDFEAILRDGIEGDADKVEAVIEELVSETARYEDANMEALIHEGQTRVIEYMGIEDWR